MSTDEYFSSGPSFERPIFDAVLGHLQSLAPDIWYELLSVGVFFKRRTSFVQLRTMTRWVALAFNLDRKLDSGRLSRKVIEHGGRYYHVVNVRGADEVDDEIRDWLTEAWASDE